MAVRLVSAPAIKFKCGQCGAESEADESDFKRLGVMPPRWECKCAFCNAPVVCSPSALIALEVNK